MKTIRIRWQSFCTAFAYVIAGILFYIVTPKFHKIYIDLLEDEPIPILSKTVTFYPYIWLVLPVIGILLVIKDIYFPENIKRRNWPYVIALFVLFLFVAYSLFAPLMIIRKGFHN